MIAVSNSCRNACNSDTLKYKEYIVINNQTIEIKGKLSATAFNDKNFIGTFNLKSLTFETENNIDFKEKEFEYYKQVNNESFKIGTFITTEVEDSDTNELVKVVAMDYGLKFATPYATALDYDSGDITMQDVLNEIITNVGIQLSSKSQTLPNKDFIVDSNQFVNSEVYGDVISAIAGINGMFAIIDSDDKLKIFTTEDAITEKTRIIEEEINPNIYNNNNSTITAKYSFNNAENVKINLNYNYYKENIEVDNIKYKRNESPFYFQLITMHDSSYVKSYLIGEPYDINYINGDYNIDVINSKIYNPELEEIIASQTISDNSITGFMIVTPELSYIYANDEEYDKYVDKYFNGNYEIATDEYIPKIIFNINVYKIVEETYQEKEIIEDYTELDDKRDTHPITIVELGMSQVQGVQVQARWEEGIELYGEHYLILNDNPFAYTMEKRQELVGNILDQVKGLGYSSFESRFAFKPYLQRGDAIKFRNKNGDLIDSIVLKIDTNYDDITLSAPSIADASVDYVVQSIESIARHAEVIANQATADIILTSTQVTELSNTVDSNYQNINENFSNYYTVEQMDEMIINANSGVTNKFIQVGGNNLLRNTGLWFEIEPSADINVYPSSTLYPSGSLFFEAVKNYEFWDGFAVRISNDDAINNNSILLQNGNFSQKIDVPNGDYSLSFKYIKHNPLATANVVINGNSYSLDSETLKEFYTGEFDSESNEYITLPLKVTSRYIQLTFTCNTNNAVEVYDIMCNKGLSRAVYTQNENETTTDTVNISKGITITSTNMETIFKANANGIRILTLSNQVVAYFTDKGLNTKEAVIEDEANICGTLVKEVGDQTWFTRL